VLHLKVELRLERVEKGKEPEVLLSRVDVMEVERQNPEATKRLFAYLIDSAGYRMWRALQELNQSRHFF